MNGQKAQKIAGDQDQDSPTDCEASSESTFKVTTRAKKSAA